MNSGTTLIFENHGLKWSIDLAIPYTLIRGDNATRKTFLIHNLKQCLRGLKLQHENIESRLGFTDVIFLDIDSSITDLEQILFAEDALILIDDADFLRIRYHDLESWLTDGYYNTYIIFGRGIWQLSLLDGSVGTIQFNNETKTFTFVQEGIAWYSQLGKPPNYFI